MIELDAIESSTNAALLAQLAGCDETEAQDELDRIGGLKGLLEYEPGVVGRFARMRMRRVALATAMELARRLIRGAARGACQGRVGRAGRATFRASPRASCQRGALGGGVGRQERDSEVL